MKTTRALIGLLLILTMPVFADDTTPPEMSPDVKLLGDLEHVEKPPDGWFKPDPAPTDPYDAEAQLRIYDAKHMNKTANPIVTGIRLYDRGAYTPRPTWLGEKNPIGFHFMAYGDVRVAGAFYNAGGAGSDDESVIAARLNLDMDLALTATERFHAFVRPLDKNGSFTRYQISGAGDDEFVDELDFDLETLFFEGDVGAIRQGLTGKISQLDLPIAFGRVPLFTQNGIWLQDAFDGGAFTISAKNNPRYDISNMDLTFFAGFNQVTTAADPTNEARLIGMAGFADAFKGYVEFGYGYVDADVADHSYHNLTAAFTKRYFGRLSNSVRVIGNVGQTGPAKTADGVLLLVENSFHKTDPIRRVPYVNLFAGFNSPQPLARANGTGGVLANTGINFESDGLTNYPTLDATAADSYGGAIGYGYLFPALNRQIVVEAAVVERMGGSASGSEYALGVRYQHPINNAWIVRADVMHGWRQGQNDVYGVRLELRRKF